MSSESEFNFVTLPLLSSAMKSTFLGILLLTIFAASCSDDAEERVRQNQKSLKKQEQVFSSISRSWRFNTQPINSASESLTGSWPQWRIFLSELSKQPKSTLGAFRKHARNLSDKAADLNNNIPGRYNKPEIKSRIAVLSTKINQLNLFVNLNEVPAAKVIELISEINVELNSLQLQMGEIVRKSTIPKEVGESDLIKMRDTSRAIKSNSQIKGVEFE